MRETTDIKTPAGHDLKVVTFLNGLESRALQVPYLKTAAELDQEKVKELGERAARFEAAQNLALKIVVLSFDGETDPDKVLAAVLLLPSSEYKFVVKSINAVVTDEDFNEKKKES